MADRDSFGHMFVDALFDIFSEATKPKPKIEGVAYDDDEDEFHVTWRYPDGHTEVGVYIDKARIVPVTTRSTPRKCSTYTPVDACEDRDCYYHRNHPASERPRIL